MKTLKQLRCAWGWWHIGVSARKARQLAGHNVRKEDIKNEVIVIVVMCLAYAAVAWNDAELARSAATSATAQQLKAETALVNMLSGKAMLIDAKTWTQCYSSTVM